MGKEYTHIKANGLRNELKDINKNLRKLATVLEDMLILQHVASVKHTHEHEKHETYSSDLPDELERYGDSRLRAGRK